MEDFEKLVSFLLLILFYFCFVKGVITKIMTSHGDLRVDTLLKSGGLGKPLFLIHSDWISMKTMSHDTLGQLPTSQTLSPSHSVFPMAACQKDFCRLGPQDTKSQLFNCMALAWFVSPWKSARPIPVLCRGWWVVFQHGLTFMGTAILNKQTDHMQEKMLPCFLKFGFLIGRGLSRILYAALWLVRVQESFLYLPPPLYTKQYKVCNNPIDTLWTVCH